MEQGVRRMSPVELTVCPFCGERLSPREQMARKVRKKFICSKCEKVADERYRV